MKHPIKMSRIKHILAITLSLLLIAIIADAQVSQRRRAQPPQQQQQQSQQQATDMAHFEPGHVCSRDCFTTTFNADNTRFILKRSSKCNEAIVLGYILRNKETQVEGAEQKLYLPADKRAVSIPTKDGYDYLISKWYHPDEYEIYERQLREKIDISFKWNKYTRTYFAYFKNKTGKGFTIYMQYWTGDRWIDSPAILDAQGGSAAAGPYKRVRFTPLKL